MCGIAGLAYRRAHDFRQEADRRVQTMIELFAQAVGRFAHAGAAILASSASHSATPARSPMACRMPRLC